MATLSQLRLLDAAVLVMGAAMKLAETVTFPDRDRFLCVARRLGLAIRLEPTRQMLLAASPRVVEMSGRVRTLIEMIEVETGDDASRSGLAGLLLRALEWKSCDEGGSRELFRHHADLSCLRRRLCLPDPG